MPRPVLMLVVLAILVIGIVVALSMSAREVPTKPMEVEVNSDAAPN